MTLNIPFRSLIIYEDRQQIAKLIVETLKRLSVASGGTSSVTDLWGNIYAIMTDAVTKNLHIEDEVAKMLHSDHKPHHILCKSHTCEKLDHPCIAALSEIENEIGYAELVIK